MTVQAHDTANTAAGAARAGQTRVSETGWGYVLRTDTELCNQACLIERVCAATGLVLVLAAGGPWIVPQVNADVVLADQSSRVMSSFGLLMSALMFLWISERGFAREVHVNILRRRLRLNLCNRRGRTRTLRELPFEQISSAYVRRCGRGAQLFVRHARGGAPIHLASGRESTLRILHERLVREIRPTEAGIAGWQRVGRRLRPVAA